MVNGKGFQENMKSYKQLMNSLKEDSTLRQLSDEEIKQLRTVFLNAFVALSECCARNGLTVMLIGGSALGAVRHKGFIPWDDDFDVAMPRKDFERLKTLFEKELGSNYILASPNYKNNANNRFPMMLVRDTVFIEAGGSTDPEKSRIKIDIFIIENIPKNRIARTLKGVWCSGLMFIASLEDTYEHRGKNLEQFMCKTKEGRKAYRRRVFWGRLFSFFRFQKWMNIVDSACQYKKRSLLMGIPTGRGHYFGEIRPAVSFLPASKGVFEGIEVNLPGDPNDYLRNLYGENYMELPPKEKRERHYFVDIRFKENNIDG